eukprot:3941814-Lingulodinium_polyedra.AAC.1
MWLGSPRGASESRSSTSSVGFRAPSRSRRPSCVPAPSSWTVFGRGSPLIEFSSWAKTKSPKLE